MKTSRNRAPKSRSSNPKWHEFNAHRRLLWSMLLAVATAALAPLAPSLRLALGWDAGVICFLALTWWSLHECQRENMQETVLAQDQGRAGVLVVGIMATSASLAAIFFLLQAAKTLSAGTLAVYVALSVITIVCSWVLMHVLFGLHYAHRYYRDDPKTPDTDATRGLKFPGDHPPDYWDFLYFSFVIGMTSQVSDVQVTSPPMRHLVLNHSLLSFAFYTVILALSINIVAGLI